MIAIVNVSKGSPFGMQDYELRINTRFIAKFKHKREDGLAKCLMAAAKAAEKAKWEDFREMIDKLHDSSK